MESICLKCALCCDGTIFADLRISAADQERLTQAGVRTSSLKLKQPCPALCGKVCQAYEGRPDHCRQFECLVLQRVKAGELSPRSALSVIRKAQRRSNRVRRLLEYLRRDDETGRQALSSEFRQLSRRMSQEQHSARDVRVYGDLTLAIQELNSFLAEEFYR